MQVHVGRVKHLHATLKRNPALIEIAGSTSGGDLANGVAVYATLEQAEALIGNLTTAVAALRSIDPSQDG